MSKWVLSSNSTTTYRAGDWIGDGISEMDWISRNNFELGDRVYTYEVLLNNGRGGIVYKTIVVDTNRTLTNKIDDAEYWIGGAYLDCITTRLSLTNLGISSYRVTL